ncbi:MAG: ribonuclease P protein component [Chloroflexota bacterium]
MGKDGFAEEAAQGSVAAGSISRARRGRLKGGRHFSATFDQGRTWGNRFLLIKALPNAAEEVCLGFAVGKKLGKAVERNKLRRRLRDWSRQIAIKPGWNLIVVAREEAMQAEFNQLGTALEGLLRQAGLLAEA